MNESKEKYKRQEGHRSEAIMEEEDVNYEYVNSIVREEQNNKRNVENGGKHQYMKNDFTSRGPDNNTSESKRCANNYGDESDNELLNELEYNCESEEELDIPTEENFLKSSTSVSGDDETMETSFGRPRSVHFEDEKWEDGEYRIKKEREAERVDAWHDLHCGRQEVYQFSSLERDFEATQEVPFSGSGRLHNIKSANRESVREFLRRKREEVGDQLQLDNRRRVSPNERKPDSESRSVERRNSRSRERTRMEIDPLDRNSDRKVRNPYSVSDVSYRESGKEQHLSRSRTPKRTNGYSKSGRTLVPINGVDPSEGIIISRRDYAMYKSLVGAGQNPTSVVGNRETRRVTKTKKPTSPKLGSHKR